MEKFAVSLGDRTELNLLIEIRMASLCSHVGIACTK